MPLGENNTVVVKNINNTGENEYRKHENHRALPVTDQDKPLNKDNIPTNTLLLGKADKTLYVLCVHEDFYSIGNEKFASLSAAAQHVTGKRRNGREFWKTIDWVSVEDAYSK